MVGASEDDIKILFSKRFVLPFESGVIVIKHWRMQNTLRKDRYKPTRYTEEISHLEIKENGAYTEWQPNGNQPVPQVKLSKVNTIDATHRKNNKKKDMKPYNENEHSDDGLPSLDLDTRETSSKPQKKKVPDSVQAIFNVFDDNPDRSVWIVRPVEREAAKALNEAYGIDEIEKRYTLIKKHRDEQMCPKIYSPSDMSKKMLQMETYLKNL